MPVQRSQVYQLFRHTLRITEFWIPLFSQLSWRGLPIREKLRQSDEGVCVCECGAFRIAGEEQKSDRCNFDLDGIRSRGLRTLISQNGTRRKSMVEAKTSVNVGIKLTPRWLLQSRRVTYLSMSKISDSFYDCEVCSLLSISRSKEVTSLEKSRSIYFEKH